MQWQFWGSSPLARGARVSCAGIPVTERLIPARAGNTQSLLRDLSSFSAHPRSRGEHPPGRRPVPVAGGSSPLARGTHGDKVRQWTGTRLIPARAGNTTMTSKTFTSRSAHPRSRGEHVRGRGGCHSRGGSSPLARGTPNNELCVPRMNRLIPARAGNTRMYKAWG